MILFVSLLHQNCTFWGYVTVVGIAGSEIRVNSNPK